MKKEILGGLRQAIERGESLEQAKQSFINAGYNPQEVEKAANSLRGVIDKIQQPPQNTPHSSPQPQKQSQNPEQIQSGQIPHRSQLPQNLKQNYPEKRVSPPPQESSEQSSQPEIGNLPENPKFQNKPKQLPNQNIPEKKGKGYKIILTLLVIILILLILGLLGMVFFKEEIMSII